MTYDFFASYNDQIPVVEFILNELNLHIYDLSSDWGKEVKIYGNSLAVAERVKAEAGQSNFQLWAPRLGGEVIFRRIELDPKRCKGHTFRYSTDGLGLIQMYLGGQNANSLNKSHIGHFNEKSAKTVSRCTEVDLFFVALLSVAPPFCTLRTPPDQYIALIISRDHI